MSICNGKDVGDRDAFERLKLVATLATIIFADPSSATNFTTAVARARAILSAADDSLIQNPDLRCVDEEPK